MRTTSRTRIYLRCLHLIMNRLRALLVGAPLWVSHGKRSASRCRPCGRRSPPGPGCSLSPAGKAIARRSVYRCPDGSGDRVREEGSRNPDHARRSLVSGGVAGESEDLIGRSGVAGQGYSEDQSSIRYLTCCGESSPSGDREGGRSIVWYLPAGSGETTGAEHGRPRCNEGLRGPLKADSLMA